MIKNILTIVLLINCKIVAITSASVSATTEAAPQMETTISSTTEGLDVATKADKITSTEGPAHSKLSEMSAESLILDDIERQLQDIFVVNIMPQSKTTSAPHASDEFSSVEMESSDTGGKKLGLGRRTNFRTRLNCRCVIHNRCAKSDSCLKETKKK